MIFDTLTIREANNIRGNSTLPDYHWSHGMLADIQPIPIHLGVFSDESTSVLLQICGTKATELSAIVLLTYQCRSHQFGMADTLIEQESVIKMLNYEF